MSRFIMDFREVSRLIKHKNPKRYFYAVADLPYVRQQEMPWVGKKNLILGAAENPVKVTKEDMKIARAEKPMPVPRSHEDVPSFKDELSHSKLYRNVTNKVREYKNFSPEGNISRWSMAQFVGHGKSANIPKEDYFKIYNSLDWPASRKRIHERAIDNLMNPQARVKPGQEKHFVMIIGPPGSGKSTIGGFHAHSITPHFTHIDVDRMRAELPEYEGWNSTAGHQEASYLNYGPFMNRAFDQNHHIIYDATGSGSLTMENELKHAKDRDYKTHLIFVNRPSYESMAGAWNRFLHNPYGAKHPEKDPSRFVDPFWVYDHIGSRPEQSYAYLKTIPHVDHYMKIDPRVPKGEAAAIVEQGYRK